MSIKDLSIFDRSLSLADLREETREEVINEWDLKNGLQWGSEYRQYEYRKHLNTKLFEFGFQMVRYSNRSVFKWFGIQIVGLCVLCSMY